MSGSDPARRCRCLLIRRPHYVGDHAELIQDCGCAHGEGHSCPVPWLTANEWKYGRSCDGIAPDNLIGLRSNERGEGTGNTNAPDPHCITALRDQDST